MKYTYIDESGSTGKAGDLVIFASITTADPRVVEKTIKKLWRAKPQFHPYGELHAKEVDDATRKRVLIQLAELPITIRHQTFDKRTSKLAPIVAYYSALENFIKLHKSSIKFIVDKKDTNKKRSAVINKLGLQSSFIDVSFEESYRVKQLQAVDFVAWSLGRLYEHNDASFYNLINHKESPSL